jgi:hypothetical protein
MDLRQDVDIIPSFQDFAETERADEESPLLTRMDIVNLIRCRIF